MDITLSNIEHVINPGARGGMRPSYVLGEVRIVANSREEIDQMIYAMQRWANGTFEDVVISRPDPEGPLEVATNVLPPDPETLPVEEIDIDPFTGEPR